MFCIFKFKIKKRRLLIFGNYGAINFGDEAILKGLLKRIDPFEWKITVMSANPKYTHKNYRVKSIYPPPFGIRSLLRFSLFKTLREIKRSNLIFFGGGGLFQDREEKAFSLWAYYLKMCLKRKKKVAIIANSVGPINRNSYQKKAKKFFRKIPFFSVRDFSSENLLKDLGVPKRKISLATDAAFFLDIKNKPGKKSGIIICLHGQHTAERELIEIKKFVQAQKKQGEKVFFLPMQSDIVGDHKLAKKLKIPCHNPKNVNEVRDIIAKSKLIVSSRLHGIILAILSGTPFIAFSKMPKVESFLTSLGLNKYFIHSIASKEISKLTLHIFKKDKQIRQNIREVAKEEKRKTVFILPDFI